MYYAAGCDANEVLQHWGEYLTTILEEKGAFFASEFFGDDYFIGGTENDRYKNDF